jgi:acetyl-CoA acyltransferase
MGCVQQLGAQSLNIGRMAVLSAGLPESVPAVTIDRQCGSSQQAVHFAAQGVLSGAYDIVVAAGVEHMTLVPIGAQAPQYGDPISPAIAARYASAGGLVNQGIAAERIAAKWGLSREDLDVYGARSQQLADQAANEGRFKNEIVALTKKMRDKETGEISESSELALRDEGIRPGTTVEVLAGLKPAFMEDGLITAGNSSQIADGASACLIMSEERAAALHLTPRARFHAFALAGVDPVAMLTGPIPATEKILARTKMSIDDLDLIEINEAFASVVLAWEKELHPDMGRVNVNGGAIALGHPLGCSGAKLLATLLNELERTGGHFGLLTMCEGGGMANATIIERL